MKKIILFYGLISGFIVTAFMVFGSIMLYRDAEFEGNMILGFTVMFAAFSLIYFGIKNYRDNQNGGIITFGQALKIGLLITLIASTMYVGVWLVEYYFFIPDFMDKYIAYELKKTLPEDLERKTAEMASFNEMYKNPLFVVLISYTEILPVGLVVSLISALVLKRNTKVAL